MKVLGLFSGIGGFELGFQRAGFEIAAMCEIEPYCRAVLKKHWPKVPVFEDVRELTYEVLDTFGCLPDVITGGFPCQDISLAGKGAGLEGERSGLWREFHRVIAETRPRYAVIENVSALRSRGLDEVLRQLAEIGYDAEWHCIPASAVGAPHRRDRVWIVAYTNIQPSQLDGIPGNLGSTAHCHERAREERQWFRNAADHCRENVADASCGRRGRPGGGETQQPGRTEVVGTSQEMADTGRARLAPPEQETIFGARGWDERRPASERGWWFAEPDVGRVAHGVPSRVDRLRSLGNAVVPQIPEILATAILEAEVYA